MVVDSHGLALPAAFVTLLQCTDKDGLRSHPTATDRNGRFELPAPTYSHLPTYVMVEAHGHAPFCSALQSAEMNIELQPARELSLQLVYDGEPYRHRWLTLNVGGELATLPIDPWRPQLRGQRLARTDADGRVTFGDLPAVPCTLQVDAPAASFPLRPRTAPAPRQTLTLPPAAPQAPESK